MQVTQMNIKPQWIVTNSKPKPKPSVTKAKNKYKNNLKIK